MKILKTLLEFMIFSWLHNPPLNHQIMTLELSRDDIVSWRAPQKKWWHKIF